MREIHSVSLLTGQCRHVERATIRDGRWRSVAFPAIATLLTHPSEGPILFDTGYDPAFLAATQPFPERLYRWTTPVELKPRQDAASQCARRGIDPNDIRHLVLSHFHADHISGMHAFPKAKIHCARAGFEQTQHGGRFARTRHGILRSLIPPDFAGRAHFFEEQPLVLLPSGLHPFERGADILGDGSLLAVDLPGHCPGHWGLAINDTRWGLHFFVADASWSLNAIRRNMPPPAVTTAFLGHTEEARATLTALHRLWQRNPEIRLTLCHCAERTAEARLEET